MLSCPDMGGSRRGLWSRVGRLSVALMRNCQVQQISGRSCLTDVDPGVFRAAANLSVGVLRTLLTLCEDVAFVGSSWTREGSNCMLGEQGVEFMGISFQKESD